MTGHFISKNVYRHFSLWSHLVKETGGWPLEAYSLRLATWDTMCLWFSTHKYPIHQAWLSTESLQVWTGCDGSFMPGHLRGKTIAKIILYRIRKTTAILMKVWSQLVNWWNKKKNWSCNKLLKENTKLNGSIGGRIWEVQLAGGSGHYGALDTWICDTKPGVSLRVLILCKQELMASRALDQWQSLLPNK